MTQRKVAVALVALVPFLGGFSFLRGEDRDVERGNESYRAGRYDEARAHYEAAEARGEHPALALNRGAALYKLAESSEGEERRRYFDEAARAFHRAAAAASDIETRARAHYNLGNARFRQGRYADAAAAYRASLSEDPSRDDARLNLALALRARDQQAAREARAGAHQRPRAGRTRDDGDRDPSAAREPAGGEADERRRSEPQASARRRQPSDRDDRPREAPESISLDDVERKLDELERLSRDIWLERIRRRAQSVEGGEAAW